VEENSTLDKRLEDYASSEVESPIVATSSKIAWSSPWYHVRQDKIRLPDGNLGVYNIVEHPGAAWIVPVTTRGEIVLIRHYRYTVLH
jgi:hypothetical protein